jgi:hypothetical protein
VWEQGGICAKLCWKSEGSGGSKLGIDG